MQLSSGVYGISATWTPPSWLNLEGTGYGLHVIGTGKSTTIKPLAGFTGTSIIDVSPSATPYLNGRYYNFRNFNIDGNTYAGTGVHGLYSSKLSKGVTQSTFEKLGIYYTSGDGLRFDNAWTVSVKNIIADYVVGNAFCMGYTTGTDLPFDITMENTYAGHIGEGMAGYRLYGGHYNLMNITGINGGTTTSTSLDWGVFGGVLTDGDPATALVYADIIGGDAESFTRYGIWIKSGSVVNMKSGLSILASHDDTVAVRTDNLLNKTMMMESSVLVYAGGHTWANGYAFHAGVGTTYPPFIRHFQLSSNVDSQHYYWIDTGTYTGAVASGGSAALIPLITTYLPYDTISVTFMGSPININDVHFVHLDYPIRDIIEWTVQCNTKNATPITVDVLGQAYTASTLPSSTICSGLGTCPTGGTTTYSNQHVWNSTTKTSVANYDLMFKVTQAPTTSTQCTVTLYIMK